MGSKFAMKFSHVGWADSRSLRDYIAGLRKKNNCEFAIEKLAIKSADKERHEHDPVINTEKNENFHKSLYRDIYVCGPVLF